MPTDAHFRPLFAAADAAATVTISFDGNDVAVPRGCSVAAALLAAGVSTFRTTPVSGQPRAPYCMMGACFDCLVEIDGLPNRQSCLIAVAPGMRVRTQAGLRGLDAGPVAEENAHVG